MCLQGSKVCSSTHSCSAVCVSCFSFLPGTRLACAGPSQVVMEEYATSCSAKLAPSTEAHVYACAADVPCACQTGWYADPKHWRRNTAIAFAAMFACAIPAFLFSARNEQHWQVPARPIPSQRWCKNFPEEKSDRIGGAT